MRILVRVSGESVGTLEISKDWPDVELVADLDVSIARNVDCRT